MATTVIASMDVSRSGPAEIAFVLDWLSAEPADDCLEDIERLSALLEGLDDAALTSDDLYRLLGPLSARVADIAGRVRPRLLSAGLPLPHALHESTARLCAAMVHAARLAARLGHTLDAAAPDAGDALPALAAHGLAQLAEAYKLACMAAIDGVPGLWRGASGLWRVAGEGRGGYATAAACTFKQMVAVATLQPESLSAREIAWLFDFLATAASETEASTLAPLSDQASFWMDLAGDAAPVARIRRTPPAGADILHFQAIVLARRLSGQIDALERRIADAELAGQDRDVDLLDAERSGLPLGLTPAEVLSLLGRMRERWTTPPNRSLPRRRQDYTMQVCVGLGAIRRMLQRGEDEAALREWTVTNESPGGFALVGESSTGDAVEAVGAGVPLVLRRDAGQPWTLCLVRWVRSERPGVVGLGLQTVAQGCSPVSVGFSGDALPRTAPALCLPPLAGLRRHHAILAPAGTYTSRRFVLVREGEQLYVAQCRVLSLEAQTASVELFQYENDPYAL